MLVAQVARSSRTNGTQSIIRQLATATEAISTAAPPPSPQWKRPVAPGVVKAYDEALALLKKDSKLKTRELQQRTKASKDTGALNDQLFKLELESQVNLPEVRWAVKNGHVDMSKKVHRHLLEMQWRNGGELDLLMERIHQMNVLPDVLASLHPTAALNVFLDRKNWRAATGSKLVEPGVFIPSRMTKVAPRIQATVFHPETRLYTLMIVDLDVPDTGNQSFQNYLHLLQTNIPLSAQSTYQRDIDLNTAQISYQPPHPQKGTPYHRYVTLLLPQQDTLNITESDISSRAGFDVREFASKHNLGYFPGEPEGVHMQMVPETYKQKIGKGMAGGIHMWRAVWDEDVSTIYKDVLGLPEPTYGHPPRPDRYGGVRASRYYGVRDSS